MANVDFGRYRKIVQMFWDPEPANDKLLDQPVWCLGQSYKLQKDGPIRNAAQGQTKNDKQKLAAVVRTETREHPTSPALLPKHAPDTPPESTPSSFSSTGYSDASHDNGWPQDFLNDFESRFWMTYRNEFKPIPRSTDPRALGAMSLSMRIKYQLGDQGGFSTDSGWGCMIRSGQSLLANAIAMVRLGRGTYVLLLNRLTTYHESRLAPWPE